MRHSLLAVLVVALMLPSVAAGNEMAENASCMGLGASFYGQFAPQQMAFVVAFVNESAATAGATYSFFAQEKEGGAIPAPCGTRLE
jgi:hypothetical protein